MDRRSQSIALEKQHVHDVYERIAPHFSDARYKAWPRVKEFLLGLEPGSIVADVGCGNGKYLGINKHIYKIGSDCCSTLVNIAHRADHEAMVCDNIRLPYRDNSFDAVISIAVIHHFATTERRAQALNELARICRPGGQIMIYVWAMEQKLRKFHVQDVLVPWHLQPRNLKNKERSRKFLPNGLTSNGSSVENDVVKNSSHKLKMQSFPTAAGNTYSISHSTLRRQPFIPSQSSTELVNGLSKPATKHTRSPLLRTNSDQGYDPITYAEKSHFKRLLIPTRSDSVDEVFVNISTEEDRITCKELFTNDITNIKSHHSVSKETGPKKANGAPPRMSSIEGKEHRETVEEPSLFESFTSTATQILRAISRQSSLEIEKQSPKEVKGKMSTFGKSIIFCDPEINGHVDKEVYLNCNGHKSVPNGYSQGSSSNCAIDDIFQKLTVDSPASVTNGITPVQNGYSSDKEGKEGIQQTQPSHDVKIYNSSTSIPLKPLQTNQPIIGMNCVTAQGEAYHKSRPLRHLPHMGVGRERDSSVESVSSSDDSLTAYPVEMKNSDQSYHFKTAEQTENNPICTYPNIPSKKHIRTLSSDSDCDSFVHITNGEGQGSVSSEGDANCNDTASTVLPTSTHNSSQCNGSVATCTLIEQVPSNQEPNTVKSEVTKQLELKSLPDTKLNSNSQADDLTPTKDTCTPTQNGASPEDKQVLQTSPKPSIPFKKNDPSLYLRYYHVFREGELADLIEQHVDSLHIIRNYYDHANWCVIAEKVQVWTI
ncbi:uncharacterized protein LOC117305545 [Asterias rubens]|uniref:uncharacterized protein LOC117305545 n=1 Tax=Asterias rubens TaxID=7604 RepID=UPI001455A332|nr:uncharacterized protein LOC117305545 [Asterias rubens]XP_033646318.1 uncharacterized protein LOC117305545 [Asterias rubens]